MTDYPNVTVSVATPTAALPTSDTEAEGILMEEIAALRRDLEAMPTADDVVRSVYDALCDDETGQVLEVCRARHPGLLRARDQVSTFSELRLLRLPGPGNLWKLTRPLTWGPYVLPAGFTSDGNSSPLTHPASEAAGWLHDYLYRKGSKPWCTRAEVDAVFYRAMLSDGVPRWLATLQWLSVRAMGGRYWQRLPVSIAREDW